MERSSGRAHHQNKVTKVWQSGSQTSECLRNTRQLVKHTEPLGLTWQGPRNLQYEEIFQEILMQGVWGPHLKKLQYSIKSITLLSQENSERQLSESCFRPLYASVSQFMKRGNKTHFTKLLRKLNRQKCLKALYLAVSRPSNVHPFHLPLLIYIIQEGSGSGYL